MGTLKTIQYFKLRESIDQSNKSINQSVNQIDQSIGELKNKQ
jgi:hypothetical protein